MLATRKRENDSEQSPYQRKGNYERHLVEASFARVAPSRLNRVMPCIAKGAGRAH